MRTAGSTNRRTLRQRRSHPILGESAFLIVFATCPAESNHFRLKTLIALQQFTLRCKISLDRLAKFRLNQQRKR